MAIDFARYYVARRIVDKMDENGESFPRLLVTAIQLAAFVVVAGLAVCLAVFAVSFTLFELFGW